ncbi:MAG TPA: TonB-dependent receptor [Bacteroidota bacterium]|nr:TonB-dependent receptor [Bacteroidota bacterium]
MFRKLQPVLCLALILLFASVSVQAGTTGKIRGKVVDVKSGEALVGASVLLEGTSMGASTDVNGVYLVLNVPPGKYKVRCSYLGYQSVVVSNVEVTVDLTTERNFSLNGEEGVQMQERVIVAEAPLVNKSATNEVANMEADQIANMPVRGVQNIVALSGGVVSQGGNLYMRGGRTGEVAYYVDGVLSTNPINRQNAVTVINDAIEEVSTQVGGMTAEYGGAMSGVVNTTTKIGTPNYNFSAQAITDGFLSGTKKYLGTYSYGLNEYNLTVSGPVMKNDQHVKFFAAGERIFNRSDATFLNGVQFPGNFDSTAFVNTDYTVINKDSSIYTSLPGGSTPARSKLAQLFNNTGITSGRNLGGLSNDSWGGQGNIYFDYPNLNVKVGGSFNQETQYSSVGKSLDVIQLLTNTYRPGETQTTDGSAYVKMTQVFNPATYYTVNVGYFTYYQESGDALLWRNYTEYGNPDNPANWALIGRSEEPPTMQIYGFPFSAPGTLQAAPNGLAAGYYGKSLRESFQGRLDFVHEFGKEWELKVGGEGEYYTIRSYSVNGFGLNLERFQNPTQSDWFVYNAANVNNYGYDIYGNKFNGGSFTDNTGTTVNLPNDGARHPVTAGAYVQNKFELTDFILNLGARFDYISPGGKGFRDPGLIGLESIDGIPLVADSSLIAQDATLQVSPRLGFSFPVSDQTVFHAEYGKFVAQAALSDLYDSRAVQGRFLQGGYARQFPNPNLKPERTTDYQIGFRQQLGQISAFDLSLFYKNTKDLIVIRQVVPEPGAQYSAYISNENGDFGTVRGLSFRFDVRRTNRIAMTSNLTLQSSLATGSASGSHFDIAWQDNSGPTGRPYFPVIPAPTDFDRTAFGNVSLDYRYDANDGPTLFDSKILERAGANLLFSFTSGRRYTTQTVSSNFFPINAPTPFEDLNSSTAPWNFQLDLRLDKAVPVFGNNTLDIYVWVVNLLNTQNVTNIYEATGLANDDGWLATATGQNWVQQYGPEAQKIYQYLEDRTDFYGTPRVIRVGAKLEF